MNRRLRRAAQEAHHKAQCVPGLGKLGRVVDAGGAESGRRELVFTQYGWRKHKPVNAMNAMEFHDSPKYQ